MGKETRLFESKEHKSRSDTAEFLNHIAEKLENGKVVLRRGQKELVVDIPENLILEVQVEDENKKVKGILHSLEIEIKWYDNDEVAGPLELG